MPVSDSKKASNRKHDMTHFKYFTTKWKTDEFEALDHFCEMHGIPKNGFVRTVVKEAIEKGYIPEKLKKE